MKAKICSRRTALKAAFFLVLIVACVLTLYPFIIMISGSFKTDLEMNSHPLRIIPATATIEHYITLFATIPFFRQLGNSLLVSILAAAGAMLFNGLVAYGFSRFDFRGKQPLFSLLLATMLIPSQVYLVPQFQMYKSMSLFGTYVPLIIPALTNAFGVFLICQTMKQIPVDLYESATIDGCGEFRIFLRIAVPLSAAGIGIQGVLTFMNTWNDFLTPLIYLNKETLFTLPIGLMKLQSFYNISYGAPLAGAALSCVPVVILIGLVGQKYFIQGMMAGAVKG